MTRCYEFYCLYEKTPERCDIKARAVTWRVESYMLAHKVRGVKFNYSQEDKDRFYNVFDEIGSEKAFASLGKQNVKKLPVGQFNVILVDPPWTYRIKTSYSPEKYYPVLSTQKISEMEIPTAKDAVLFLWSTNPVLEEALNVMKAWGFGYKTNFVWVKDRSGTGHYILGQHELLLIGIKGQIGTPLPENRPPSIINAPKTRHSEKPKVVYEIIERMYPNHKYLELFARIKREGWTSWGNEIEG